MSHHVPSNELMSCTTPPWLPSPPCSDVGDAAQHVEEQSSEWQAVVAQVFEIYWASIGRSIEIYTRRWDYGHIIERATLSFQIGRMKCSNGAIVPMCTNHRGRLAMVMPSVAALQKQLHMQAVLAHPQWGKECSLAIAKAANIDAEWSSYTFETWLVF